MRQVKIAFLGLLAIAALACTMASAAFASSPTALLLSEAFPNGFKSGKLETVKSELQNAAGKLNGTGILVQGSLTAASTGKVEVLFLNVVKGETRCTGEGEKGTGEVLTDGEFTLVHDESVSSGVAGLLKILPLVVVCGATKIKIEGTVLILLTPVGSEVSTINTTIHCSSTVGEPAKTKFWNASNVEESALLLANFGTGFKKACEEIPGTTALEAEKMVELMN
jgi:hypothetical protein